MRRHWSASVALAVAVATAPSALAGRGEPAPPVVAFMSMGGVNPLHMDFRVDQSSRPPAGLPRAVPVPLPSKGSFDERMSALRDGPLGDMQEGVLYHLQGTRLLFVAVGAEGQTAVGSQPFTVALDVRRVGEEYAELAHDTGVLGAALSARTGTAPESWGVVVLGEDDDTYGWVATQSWVDVTTRSGGSVQGSCFAVQQVRDVHASGRMVIAAIGNTETAAIVATFPGLASEVYHVGGTDEQGRPWTPTASTEDPLLSAVMPARPYETGDLFKFKTSDFASLEGQQDFGGTSGAAPRTAGRAATLIHEARRILRDWNGGAEPLGKRGLVREGPLADGLFTRAELEALLHASALPALPASPGRHAIEGYGALNARSMKVAVDVLRGRSAQPDRSAEDAAQQRVDAARDLVLATQGC